VSGCMHAVAAVRQKIEQGRFVLLAGDEHLLRQLPAGNWIGGSIPHFVSEEDRVAARDTIHVTELPECVTGVTIQEYTRESVSDVHAHAAKNGFSVIIIPAGSEVHQVYAKDAGTYPGLFLTPIVGWIAGVDVSDIGIGCGR